MIAELAAGIGVGLVFFLLYAALFWGDTRWEDDD